MPPAAPTLKDPPASRALDCRASVQQGSAKSTARMSGPRGHPTRGPGAPSWRGQPQITTTQGGTQVAAPPQDQDQQGSRALLGGGHQDFLQGLPPTAVGKGRKGSGRGRDSTTGRRNHTQHRPVWGQERWVRLRNRA